ncbi:hypothetical protein [Plantactinospora endophytica]|uniref:hypothetical protein n=1 Tax=Plantactinospora endophytica TaxID=673535 RepID=UPI001942A484|nr:hypothetical protein [Plantactinospora endophytica]
MSESAIAHPGERQWFEVFRSLGVVCVPVPDAPPVTLLIAWPAGSRSADLRRFVRSATTVAAGRPTAVTS